MTQAQLDAVSFRLESEYFKGIHCEFDKKRITCTFDDNVYIVLNHIGKYTHVVIGVGKKSIRLSLDSFNSICDSQLGVRS